VAVQKVVQPDERNHRSGILSKSNRESDAEPLQPKTRPPGTAPRRYDPKHEDHRPASSRLTPQDRKRLTFGAPMDTTLEDDKPEGLQVPAEAAEQRKLLLFGFTLTSIRRIRNKLSDRGSTIDWRKKILRHKATEIDDPMAF
jgi:hypothetical protein